MNKQFYRTVPFNSEKNYYIKKDKVENEKYLFVLACTGGARHGDYFRGSSYSSPSTWRTADYFLRRMRKQILFAACSSVAYHFDGTGGSLVFEHENYRVQSNNDFGMPASSNFSCLNSKNPKFDIQILIDGLKVGLTRAFSEFGIEKVYAVLTPFAYKVAFASAVEQLGVWDKVVLFDVKTMGASTFFIKLFPCFVRNDFKYTGIINNEFLLYGSGDLHKPVTDPSFEYWKFSSYKETFPFNVSKMFLSVDNNHLDYYPILLEDEGNYSSQQLIDLYQFPIFTPYSFKYFEKLDSIHRRM